MRFVFCLLISVCQYFVQSYEKALKRNKEMEEKEDMPLKENAEDCLMVRFYKFALDNCILCILCEL